MLPESQQTYSPTPRRTSWLWDVLLLLAILAGVYLRFTGLNWGEETYLHPDERFLVWVTADIQPVAGDVGYFDTENSTLNPHNRGHGFFVYGTFPIFLTRYLTEAWIDAPIGWKEIVTVGRALSASFDVLTILLIALIAARLYDRRVGALAALFYALAVLPIQLSHFYKEDTFLNFFMLLAVYFAVGVYQSAEWLFTRPAALPHPITPSPPQPLNPSTPQPLTHSLAFGVALALAVACKLNAAPLALALPAAFALAWWRVPAQQRQMSQAALARTLNALVLAGVLSFLVFRVAQPYAFSGPGFFGMLPNPKWVANIQEQRNQAAGDVDFPPALQWARRPIWFAWQNLTVWGLGLPLGVLAWAGFGLLAWYMLRNRAEWTRHALLWGWVALYFGWQTLQFNPTMRYSLPIYPLLVIFAAFALFELLRAHRAALRFTAWGLMVFTLLATAVYAFAFINIYREPITRVAASRWIYQNVPGPLMLAIQPQDGAATFNQPLSLPYDNLIRPNLPLVTSFVPRQAGTLQNIVIGQIVDKQAAPGEISLALLLTDAPDSAIPLATATLNLTFNGQAQTNEPLSFRIEPPLTLTAGQTIYLRLIVPLSAATVPVTARLELPFTGELETFSQAIDLPALDAFTALPASFTLPAAARLEEVYLSYQFTPTNSGEKRLQAIISTRPDGEEPLAQAQLVSDFAHPAGPEGRGYTLALDRAVPLRTDETYYIRLTLESGDASLTLQGAGLANEGDWDDGLPLRIDGYDAFGGIYPNELNFNMYWDDNPEKRDRFKRILDSTNFIVISSSRQWGTLPRLPERFPMTTVYYRALLGCPEDKTIEWCYNVAQPGMFTGKLGFQLVQVFESSPTLGPIKINDQFAEEAFTVYDHPKVFIFQKEIGYDPQVAAGILDAVDLSKVVRVTPKRATANPMDLLLPAERLAVQQLGGTWRELFNPNWLYNRYPALAVPLWYVFIALLGWLTYPMLRYALPNLPDRGYPLARIAGMLLFAWLIWLPASFEVPAERPLMWAALLLIFSVSLWAVRIQWDDLRREWRDNRRYFLTVEALMLGAFLLFLAIRIGNPDLWHPWKGGEKPMDFSYFNAVLKSTIFPPFDPWFAGGYINYYYYGFVIVGMPVKFLGITPAVAYNLILPTLFALIALGAFSAAWNLAAGDTGRALQKRFSPLAAGLSGAAAVALIGNLGTVRMIWRGWQMLGSLGASVDDANLLVRTWWALRGFWQVVTGASLPYSLGDWYWLPSRAIPAPNDVEPITEFPFFTVLYADLHAHLIALPVTLLALVWALALFLPDDGQPGKPARFNGLTLFVGALAIGALLPTNTWDLPTYLVLGGLATFLGAWNNHKPPRIFAALGLPENLHKPLYALGSAALLVAASLLLYQPFSQWYGQGYTKANWWQGTLTPLWAYNLHWGIFLFIIVSWMFYETVDWMARTPLSALQKLRPYRDVITALLTVLAVVIVLLGLKIPLLSIDSPLPIGRGIAVVWLALPLGAWSLALILRPDQTAARRFVLFLVGTALVLTMAVELVVLQGDIGRMNTVFKFYVQCWTLFGVSAAAALFWLLNEALPTWNTSAQRTWLAVFLLLVGSGLLFPLMATTAKIKDRASENAPHTLDGMAYMKLATYNDQGTLLRLDEDYQAIQWLLNHVDGSPVIVEGNTPEYRWGTRITMHTGLPGVVGWNWHQRQQRGNVVSADWVTDRVAEIGKFYLTDSPQYAVEFLNKYNVQYIVVGQLERANYPGSGLDKFAAYDGQLWRKVFEVGETAIYQVIR